MKRLVSLFVQALNGYLLVASLLVSCTHIQLPHALHPEAELPSATTLGETVPETAKLPPSEETFRTPKRLLQLDSSHVQYGTASWYGRPFHGRRTANGEVYNMYEASAAHRTVRMGTYAVVTNLNNGRSVQVRINDRGPMKRHRILDLSYRAAQDIGMVASGTTQVKVEFFTSPQTMPSGTIQTAHLVSAPTTTASTLSSSLEPVRATSVSSVGVRQAGTVLTAQDVIQARPTLVAGHREIQMATLRDSAPPWYRGRLGPSFSRENAEHLTRQNAAPRARAAVITVAQ